MEPAGYREGIGLAFVGEFDRVEVDWIDKKLRLLWV
jgi:hypothetical protein